MKNTFAIIALCLFCLLANSACSQKNNLKLVFIRHGEKADDGDNLNCMGLNRAMQLPAVIAKKFGKPGAIYVPALHLGQATKRARMLQTATPLAGKYNININTEYDEEDYKKIAGALSAESGTVLVVWEHNAIKQILRSLGITVKPLNWDNDDFDSIWIVTFPGGTPTLTKDKEGLHPSSTCSF